MYAWKFEESLFKLTFIEHPSTRAVAYSPNGERIASGSRHGSIAVWDGKTYQLVAGQVGGHSAGVNSVAFSPDGQIIISASSDGTIRLWNAETCQAVSQPFKGHRDTVNRAEYSPDGQFIASVSDDHTVQLWNAQTGETISDPLQHPNQVWSVKYSPDGKIIASGCRDGSIRLWDVETGEEVTKPFLEHAGQALSAQGGESIPPSSVDGTVLAYSPNGQHIASVSCRDSQLRVWSLATSELVFRPIQLSGAFCPIAYSPDGKRIVSCFIDEHIENEMKIQVWDANTGETVVGPWRGGGSNGFWCAVAYSPDGFYIASASEDSNFRIWNAESGENVFNPIQVQGAMAMP